MAHESCVDSRLMGRRIGSPACWSGPETDTSTRKQRRPGLARLDTGDPQISHAIEQLRRVLGKGISILILGATGTGKDVMARAIHDESARRAGPFVAINCAAKSSAPADQFGYAQSGFAATLTGAYPAKLLAASGGTLFLDHIDKLPISRQAQIKCLLDERSVMPLGGDGSSPVGMSLICSSRKDLGSLVEKGRFRRDLYYRINGFVVRLPRLCDRSDLGAVIGSIMREDRLVGVRLDPLALRLLKRHSWPGNIRQLANVLRSAALLAKDDCVVRSEHLRARLKFDLSRAPDRRTP
jgi:transcriptional regulator of acetoin/glycerol metabolism